ncbi:uncharacterized protein LOC127806235 isoform X2 [Diospyros lotus]|uniref:uncharacterized protein LOC127806235 isoform X2 n=1 Tax=Diospyros lotus TaxID=55363 RepID=UPI00225A38B3|nr:uncharacterized protein LOC127806235 isoform X2 [Diospyros lotus]
MPNPPNQRDPDQDPRNNGSMEDSTSMTIEFLRARLLAERSVSRTARQRADELAKRVVELEEQLKIVCLQRKKAEKATTDVLAILGNHEEESSVSSEMRSGNRGDEFSSCELYSSPSCSKSLSWESGKNSSHSCEKKHMDSSGRRRGTFTSPTSGSPRRRLGKSCRQIRRREMRSAVEESRINNEMMAPRDTGGATCPQGVSTRSDIESEIQRECSNKQDKQILREGPVSGDLENQQSAANPSYYLTVDGSEKDMERALEEQAQLIGKYEEEEKAQREWEEKFRENNNSTPDSCEPGDQSDITDEREETKVQSPPCTVQTIASESQEIHLKVENICLPKESVDSQSDGLQSAPCADMECFQDQNPSFKLGNESPASDFVFPAATHKQDQQSSGNYSILPSSCLCSSHLDGSPGNKSAEIVPSHSGSSVLKQDTSGSKNVNYALMPREGPNKLGSVLESLQQAKLSLKHQLNTSLSVDDVSFKKPIRFSALDRPEVPAGCTGLFRVPSDFHLEGTTKASVLDSNVQLSLTNYSHDSGSMPSVDDRFVTRPYTELRPSVSVGDRHVAIPTSVRMSTYNTPSGEPVESWSRFSSQKAFSGITWDTGLQSSNRYPYNDLNVGIGLPSSGTNTSPSYPFYPDLMLRMPANEVPQLMSSRGTGIPSSNRGLQLVSSREPGMPVSNGGLQLISSRGAGIPSSNGGLQLGSSREPGMPLSNEGLQLVSSREPGMPLSNEGLQLVSSRGAGIPSSNGGLQLMSSAEPGMPLYNERPQFVPTGVPGMSLIDNQRQQFVSSGRSGMPMSNERPHLFSSRGPGMPLSNERQQLVSGRVAGMPLDNHFSFL